jgi:hypothetical protein
MNRISLFMAVLATVLSITALALVSAPVVSNLIWPPPPPQTYQIVIVAGQSNAVGRGPIIPEWEVDATGIYQLGRFGSTNLTVIPATEPLAHWDASGTGFALDTVNLMRSADLLDYLIIPSALGGTGFVDNMWNPGDPLYRDLVLRVRHVLKAYPGSTVRAVLWHQGESEWIEAEDGYNDEFPAQLETMITSLIDNAGLPENVPFLVGGLAPEFESTVEPNPSAVLLAVTQKRAMTCFVPSDRLLTQDGIHIEKGSLKWFGHRYFEQYQNCLSGKKL